MKSPPNNQFQELTSHDESFSDCLRRFIDRCGISYPQLHARSWIAIGYLHRLVNTPADPLNQRADGRNHGHVPSRDVVIRLAVALDLPIEEIDELLLSAGYAPLIR